MSDDPRKSSSFFGRILTNGQFLAQGQFLAVACIGVLSSFACYQWGLNSPGKDGSVESAADPVQSKVAERNRLLSVTTCQLNAAGPDFLSQKFTGIVASRRKSQLAAKTVGRVESVLVRVGSNVAQGDVLVELDQQQLVAQRNLAVAALNAAQARLRELRAGPRTQEIEQAESRVSELESNLKLSQANFARLSDLRNSSSISKQEYDESRFSLNAAEAQLQSATQALELLKEGTRVEQIESQVATVEGLVAQIAKIDADIRDQTIVAPFNGAIQMRQVDEGAVVSPGQTLLEILEATPYEVRVGLPQELVDDLSESNLAVLHDGQKLSASIARVAPAIQETTRTREVVLLLSEVSSAIVSVGSAVSVEVRQPTESQGYWVPTKSLTAGARGLWAVFVAVASPENGGQHQIERRQVELLRAYDGWSEIQGPLSPSDQLVIEGVHRVTPGQEVECVRVDALTLADLE